MENGNQVCISKTFSHHLVILRSSYFVEDAKNIHASMLSCTCMDSHSSAHEAFILKKLSLLLPFALRSLLFNNKLIQYLNNYRC